MIYLETARLILVQTPLNILKNRLRQDSFVADVHFPDGARPVTFPAEWPGDALAHFPAMIEQLEHHPERVAWGGTMIDRVAQMAVGQIGFKGVPDAEGRLEVGYGVNPSQQRRGYATEMVCALVAWALAQPNVHRVTAECREDNTGSVRVLEKSTFVRVGERVDKEDGLLVCWERVTPTDR